MRRNGSLALFVLCHVDLRSNILWLSFSMGVSECDLPELLSPHRVGQGLMILDPSDESKTFLPPAACAASDPVSVHPHAQT